ncbi:hypothetical protein FPRO03_02751 [Fusarium proliferatum]|nr:hypothetical protein FPRO03_02751 [Fusarium proliferatum]
MRSQVTVSGKPRQRSALACSTCRTKRVKCDGQRPSCSTCSTAGEVCEYTTQDSNRKPPSKRYVEALQERIRTLEAQLERFQNNAGTQDRGLSSSIEDSYSTSEGDSLPDDSSYRSPIKDISDRLGALNIGEDGQIHYFGSRSNFSLLRNSPVASSTVSSRDLQKQAADTLDQLNLRVEVSDELRNHLLDLFWSWQNTWQYLVVKELFLEDLYITHSGRYASPLLLSAVLALAARYSDRVELRSDPLEQNTAGNALAEQAKMILFYESQAPKVTTVQATALLGLREIATDKEALGWMYCDKSSKLSSSFTVTTRAYSTSHILAPRCSLQIHVAIILLHRPFVGVQRRTLDPGNFHPSTGSSHLKECSQSSHSISNIFRLYSKHYTLRRIPISAIHCAFTASIILLLETTSTDTKDRDRAIASLKVLAEALADMSTAWAWSQRALFAIRQLAREWLVSEDAFGALGINKEESRQVIGDTITGTTQGRDDGESNSSLWGAEGPHCFDMDIPFMTSEGLDYQGWIGTLFTEPGYPGDAA